jgi:hypothetical protein
MVERYTGIPKRALASLTEHFTSSPDGYFYCMMTKARGASSTESSLSGAYRTSGRREEKKHAHGGGHDPAIDYNPIAWVVQKEGFYTILHRLQHSNLLLQGGDLRSIPCSYGLNTFWGMTLQIWPACLLEHHAYLVVG